LKPAATPTAPTAAKPTATSSAAAAAATARGFAGLLLERDLGADEVVFHHAHAGVGADNADENTDQARGQADLEWFGSLFLEGKHDDEEDAEQGEESCVDANVT